MYKNELKINDLYMDENIKIENKATIWKVIEVGQYITLESTELYWGRNFNFKDWQTSELRTWLNNNVTGTFQPQTVTINDKDIVELVTIRELGNIGDRYQNEFQKFYCRPIVKISNDGYIHNSAGVFRSVEKAFFPTIDVPYDNPVNVNGTVYGPRKIKLTFTNPAGSSNVTIKATVKSTNYKLFEATVDGYSGKYIWDLEELQLNAINSFGMTIVLQITDHLGSIGTKEIEIAKGDTIVGFTDIYNDKINAYVNPTFNFTPSYSPQTTILHFIVNGNIKQQVNSPAQTKRSFKLSDSDWNSLNDGVHTFQIKLIGQVQNKTSTITYQVVKKAAILEIVTDTSDHIGRCINAPNWNYMLYQSKW